jgi:hypothetical protein
MTYINTITDNPNQKLTLKTEAGDAVTLLLSYLEGQQGWYYSFSYGSLSIQNRRLIAGPNLIRSLRFLLPFGFACTTEDGYEPIFKEDFQNGRAKFYLLNATDVEIVEDMLKYAQV